MKSVQGEGVEGTPGTEDSAGPEEETVRGRCPISLGRGWSWGLNPDIWLQGQPGTTTQTKTQPIQAKLQIVEGTALGK